jgi:hypothetical protein
MRESFKPEDRHSSGSSLPESGIPDWQKRISQAQDVSHNTLVRLLEQEWLPSLGVNVGVASEEWGECANLIPPDQHIGFGVTKETANISCRHPNNGPQ